MAEENENTKSKQPQGEAMLVATSMLKPPKSRTAMKVIPRTIAWENLFLVGGFGFVGLLLGATIFGIDNLQAVLSTVVLMAAFGYILPQLSPLKGESLLTWFGLQARDASAKRVTINGRRVKMYIGTYPLKRVAMGHTRILPAGAPVKAYAYDERGYPLATTPKNNPQLEAQRKLRSKSQQRLRPSTSLEAPPKRRSLVRDRNEQRARSAPRLPVAGEKRKSTLDVNKQIKLKKPKRKRKLRS